MEKLKMLFQSRKFWAAVVALVAAVSGVATGQIDMWQFIQAVVAIALEAAVQVGATTAYKADIFLLDPLNLAD